MIAMLLTMQMITTYQKDHTATAISQTENSDEDPSVAGEAIMHQRKKVGAKDLGQKIP